MNFVQIGTNNGRDEFNQIISNLTSPANIYLFEANKTIVPLIEENYAHLNHLHSINIIGRGVVSDKSIHTLNVGGSDEHSSILNRGNIHNNIIEFDPITFDEFIDYYSIKSIELLCIDVEGYDYEILNSIRLDRVHIKEIICEKWPYTDPNYNTGPEFFNKVISPKFITAGYKIESIVFGSMQSHHFIKT